MMMVPIFSPVVFEWEGLGLGGRVRDLFAWKRGGEGERELDQDIRKKNFHLTGAR